MENDKTKILIFGSKGQIGHQLILQSEENTKGYDLPEGDITHPEYLEKLFESLRPEVVINAAAFTDVEACEDKMALAYAINGEAVGRLAQLCKKHDSLFVHYSTDYVFDGKSQTPWTESDIPNPINHYGRSKFVGEQLIERETDRFVVLRTSWVFSESGKNFVNTMLNLAATREKLTVVNDQFGCPTYANDIATWTLKIVYQYIANNEDFPYGIYHACNSGSLSWFEFSRSIFDRARAYNLPLKLTDHLPCTSADYPTRAKRPHFSVLDTSKLQSHFKIEPRNWQEALDDFFKERMK